MKTHSTPPFRSLAVAALALAGSLSLGACNRQENPSETRKDMREERAEGNEKIHDAAKEVREDLKEGASTDTLNKDVHKVELEKIKADHEVALERCDGVPPGDQSKCRSDADAAYESAKKGVEAQP